MTYQIYLESFVEDIFCEMERIQDGVSGHIVSFDADSKRACAEKIASRLIPFIEKQLEE
jgi:hypothetical protein